MGTGSLAALPLTPHPPVPASAPRVCRHCQGLIVGRSRSATSCGAECRRASKNAYLRAYMMAYRMRVGHQERHREWMRKARERSDYRARELARQRTAYVPKRRDRLPPLTHAQYRLYCKLRWDAARMTRAEALAEILGGRI